MALNNLERYAASVDRARLLRDARVASRAPPRCSRTIGGASQVLADTLRRHPQLLAWLLEPRGHARVAGRGSRRRRSRGRSRRSRRARRARNALRRFKYRQLLRIGARDLLGDADLAATTRGAREPRGRVPRPRRGATPRPPRARCTACRATPTGRETGLAIIGMGKLGGQRAELFVRHRPDVRVRRRRRDDRRPRGAPAERRVLRARRARHRRPASRRSTDEGYVFRVDLRLRPEGRIGRRRALARRLSPLPRRARRAVGAAGAAQGARVAPATRRSRERFTALVREVVWRPGHRPPDREGGARDEARASTSRSRGKGEETVANVKLGRGGIREIEFLVQAMQLLYGGDDPWLRERATLAGARPARRARLPRARARRVRSPTRTCTCARSSIACRSSTSSRSTRCRRTPRRSGSLARRVGFAGPPRAAAVAFRRRHTTVTAAVRARVRRVLPRAAARAAARARAEPARAAGDGLRAIPSARAEPAAPPRGTPARAVRGRAAARDGARVRRHARRAVEEPDPDEALNQFERFIAAVGPRAGYIELLASEPEVLVGPHAALRGRRPAHAAPDHRARAAERRWRIPRRSRASDATRRDFRAALAPVFAPRIARGRAARPAAAHQAGARS